MMAKPGGCSRSGQLQGMHLVLFLLLILASTQAGPVVAELGELVAQGVEVTTSIAGKVNKDLEEPGKVISTSYRVGSVIASSSSRSLPQEMHLLLLLILVASTQAGPVMASLGELAAQTVEVMTSIGRGTFNKDLVEIRRGNY
ncbi:unnamed protein product [Urochloa humidicola]